MSQYVSSHQESKGRFVSSLLSHPLTVLCPRNLKSCVGRSTAGTLLQSPQAGAVKVERQYWCLIQQSNTAEFKGLTKSVLYSECCKKNGGAIGKHPRRGIILKTVGKMNVDFQIAKESFRDILDSCMIWVFS